MDGYSAAKSSALNRKMKTWLRISEHKKKFFLSSVVAERKDVQKVQTANVARTHCPLCRCESCSYNNKDELEEEDNENANESNDSSEDEKDEEILKNADENSDIYELENENNDENAGILDMLAEPQI